MWPGWQLCSCVVTKDSCWDRLQAGQEAFSLQCQHSQVAVRGDARLCLWGPVGARWGRGDPA